MALSSSILSTQSANLKGYWKCNETSGTTLADSSGNAKTLTITGTINTNYWLGEAGQEGTCFRTDGITSYANRNDSVIPSLDTQNFTLFAMVKNGTDSSVQWVNFTNSATNNDRASIGNNAGTTAGSFRVLGNSAGVLPAAVNGGVGFDNIWHSLLLRRNGTSFEMFIDGSSVASTTGTLATGSTCNRTSLMKQVRLSNATTAKGSIQHAAIWNTNLSDSEIAAIEAARTHVSNMDGLAFSSMGTVNGLDIASIRTFDGLV